MLALFAGTGGLPAVVAAALKTPPLICTLEGIEPTGVTPEITFRLETLGSFLLQLGERGVTEICFCGGITRPEIDPALLDNETKPLVPILMEALQKGDDGALRAVIDLFEMTGFKVIGAHELLPSVLMQAGVPTQRKPRDSHKDDARVGQKVLHKMAAADLGQACVLRKSKVLAQEDDAGTDAMLSTLALPFAALKPGADPMSRLAAMRPDLHDAPGAGGILFKTPKPGQERRADLPTIGPETAIAAAAAGLDGIVIEAGGVIVLDIPRVLAILDAMDMFLWVRP